MISIPNTGVPSGRSIAFLGSYFPRQCGIATFTKQLREAIAESQGAQTLVVAVDDTPEGYPYGPEVRCQLQVNQPEDYRTAAELLNIHQIEILNLQHEYGIYGGRSGEYVLALLRRLRMPIMTTLHTVLQEPTAEQRGVMRQLVRLSDRMVVMANRAVDMLRGIYGVPLEKIAMIPHGIPDLPFADSAFYKDQFRLAGRTVMLTFGLLSPGKGIDVAIRALPEIVKRHPEVIYLVVGTTHPYLLRREGVAYLNELERLAHRLGVSEHINFHHRFVSDDELAGYVGAADLYLTPYVGEAQITSGTLAYAMGAGKAVVSTPYWYAQEMLADGRGRLFPFKDAGGLAAVVNELLENDVERNALRKRAYLFARDQLWKEVAGKYLRLAEEILDSRRECPRPVPCQRADQRDLEGVPEVKTNHLRALTDDTGILQHAIFTVPDRRHGYCTDDNARALLAASEYYDLTVDESILRYLDIYLAFVTHAFEPTQGRFRNFMSYDRRWLDETGTDDTQGRVCWALGRLVALAQREDIVGLASRYFSQALERACDLAAPRSWAMTLLGIQAYLERFPGDTMARRVRQSLAERLHALFGECCTEEWPWCEDTLTYVNAMLAHGLIVAGASIPDTAMRDQGLRSLEWLVNLQLDEHGVVSLIGNQGWMCRGGHRASFDQQPVEAEALAEACVSAYRITGQRLWRDRAHRFLSWFLGNNHTSSMLYDYASGGCRDGLQQDGPNLNQGAESTLAWLLSLISIRRCDLLSEAGAEATVSDGTEGALAHR